MQVVRVLVVFFVCHLPRFVVAIVLVLMVVVVVPSERVVVAVSSYNFK